MTRGYSIVGSCQSWQRPMASTVHGAREMGVATHRAEQLCTYCYRTGEPPAGRTSAFRPFDRDDAAWMRHAACRTRGVDPNWFHPHEWDTATKNLAKGVCARCPVQQPCLDDAHDIGDGWGIRAGMTATERRHAQRHRESKAVAT